MADNVTITAGSGTTIAADELTDGTLGSVKVQYVKLMDGTLDGTAKAAVGSNGLKVDGSAVTQPISAASLPLPTSAATSTKQSDGSQKTQVVDGAGNVIGATSNALDINIKSGNPTSITANAGTNLNTSALAVETGGNLATVATNTTGLNSTVGTAASAIPSKLVQIGGSDGTNARAVKTNSSGQLDVRPLTSSDQVTVVPSGTQTVSGTVTANLGSGSNLVGKVGIDQTTPGTTNATTVTTLTSGGATPYSFISAATTNATSVKGSAGTVYSLVAMNTSGTARYVKLYNSSSAPTAGSGTPIKRFMVPANGGFAWPIPPQGVAFSSGIGFTITGNPADNDTTAIAANDVLLNVDYS